MINIIKRYELNASFKIVNDEFYITLYYDNGTIKKAFTSKEKISLITGINDGLFKAFFFSRLEQLFKKIMKFSCENYGILAKCKECQSKRFKLNGLPIQKECFKEIEPQKILKDIHYINK